MITIEALYFWIRNPPTLFLTGLNFFISFAIVFACLCRLRLTSIETLVRPRVIYGAVLVFALISALRGPILGETVNSWWSVFYGLFMLLVLLVNIHAWRTRPPLSMQKTTAHMNLDE